MNRLLTPGRIAGAYATIGGAYVIATDLMVAISLRRLDREWLAETSTDLLFIVVSAVLFYRLIKVLVGRYEAAEAALRVSEERWNFALQSAGDGVWDWDATTGKSYYSPRWKEMLGYSHADIGDSYEDWTKLIHPDDLDHVLDRMRLHLSGATEAYECDHRVRTKTGDYKWVASHGRVISRTADDRALRAVGTQRDITERKAAEARMREALEFNQTVLRSVPVGILTYLSSGEVITANPAALKFLGAEQDAVMAQNFRKIASWEKFGLLELADRALREERAVTRRGSYVSMFGRENWSELTFVPFWFEGAQRLLLIAQDLTEEQKVTEELKLLRAALNAAPTGWVVTDVHGVIEWVNPGFTKLTGYSLEEALGQSPKMLNSGQHPRAFYTNLWETVLRGEIWEGELCNRRKDGTLYYERMTIAPVRDHVGAIAHFVAMKQDITGQHELQQQLNRSQRLESIGLLASGIAHDLNNMLAPIMLSVGLIGSRHKDQPTRELLDMMQAAAQRGASVVQQVLTFARGVDGERSELDLRPLLKELAQLVRETFPREIRLTVDVPATPLCVDGDVTQLHQVLLNLAVNARDAMPEGGALRLTAASVHLDENAARLAPAGHPGDFVKLGVADTGSGIPPEIVEHIFEPFFTTKPRGKGTGLGLSTVYGIVRSHGGFVAVESTVGRGTVFSVLLPQRTPVPVPAKPVPAQRTLKGGGRSVLVVDDEASIRLATTEVLKGHGFNVVKAEDGFEALRRVRESPEGFSLVIVDLMMPGMNGYKLIPQLRLIAPRLPIIVASGMMGDATAGESRAALADCGVRIVLEKPFTEAALLAAMEAELAGEAEG